MLYVAITRAKKSLNYIKEDVKGFYKNFTNTTNMNEEIEAIKNRLNYVSKIREDITNPLQETAPKTVVPPVIIKNSEKNKKKGGLKFRNME